MFLRCRALRPRRASAAGPALARCHASRQWSSRRRCDRWSLTCGRRPSRDALTSCAGSGGGVLLLSMRRLADLVAFCLQYEFEDVVGGGDGRPTASRPATSGALELSRRAYKLARLGTRIAAARAGVVAPAVHGAAGAGLRALLPGLQQRPRAVRAGHHPGLAPSLPRGRLLRERALGAAPARLPAGAARGVRPRLPGSPATPWTRWRGSSGGPAPTCRWPSTSCASRRCPSCPPRAIDVCNIGRRSPVDPRGAPAPRPRPPDLLLLRHRRRERRRPEAAHVPRRRARRAPAPPGQPPPAEPLLHRQPRPGERARVHAGPGRDLGAVLRGGGRGDGHARGAAADRRSSSGSSAGPTP